VRGLAFRNLDVSPDAPVEQWGFEGLLAAVDRGDLGDWRRVAAAVARAPRGEVAELLDQVFDAAEDSGGAAALRRYVALAVERQERLERQAVVDELVASWRSSGLDQGTYARRLGTSRTRLNSYLNGRTVPLATLLVRARGLAEARRGQ
jgi:hypothetical protein